MMNPSPQTTRYQDSIACNSQRVCICAVKTSMYISLCIYLFMDPSVSRSINSSLYLSLPLSIYLSLPLSIYLSLHPSIYPSLYPFIYPSIPLSISPCSVSNLLSSPLLSNQQPYVCIPRCGGEGSGLYGRAGGGRDLRSVEFGCHHGDHDGAVENDR